MKLAYGFVGAVIGGVVGAALWTAISYFSGYELGIIAWLVGLACGFGMAVGSKREGGVPAGAIAAVVALISILGGKYAVAHYMSHHLAATVSLSVAEAEAFHEMEVETEMENAGAKLTPPTGRQDVAPEATEEAKKRWRKMSDAQKEQYAKDAAAKMNTLVAAVGGASSITWDMFKASFGALDLIFAALAVWYAFKLGSQAETE